MILESLVKYYSSLVQRGELDNWGYSRVGVSYALDISLDGNLKKVICLKSSDGKKMIPQMMSVPTPAKRSSGIAANFLCDNSTYILGIATKEKKQENQEKKSERAKACFLATKELHQHILPRDEEAAEALWNFFEHWEVEKALENKELATYVDDMQKGGNLVFIYKGKYLHEYELIKRVWISSKSEAQAEKVICGVTGEEDVLATLHPSIKKIRGAQSSGASLVSFNAPAFTSYGKEQGANSQTGEYAAYAYGEALNYMAEKLSYKDYIGNTALFFYAINGEKAYQDVFSSLFFGDSEYYSEEDIKRIVENICEGKSCVINQKQIDPNMEFYLLGIAPNNARLSIRFFERGTFGEYVRHLSSHQERLRIETSKGVDSLPLPTWQLLQETCRSGGDVSAVLAGEVTRAIIGNLRYPATLINAVEMRINADHRVDRKRAAIIKAYYLRNENKKMPKEVLGVGLNKETTNVPYNLGRLFAILEKIQEAANPRLNATIRDKYFGGASSTPATIIPKLIDLAQKHLRKLNGGIKIYYNKLLCEILGKFEGEYPRTLSMVERGAFQLGYYHQVEELYKTKKEEDNRNE